MASSIPFPKLSRTAARAVSRIPTLRPALPPHAARAEWVRGGPATPFFRDEAHTRPTRGLYRALLRRLGPVRSGEGCTPASPSPPAPPSPSQAPSPPPPYPHTLAALRAAWRHRRKWVSPRNTRVFLESQYALLSDLRSACAAARLQQAEEQHAAEAERRAALAAQAAAEAAARAAPAHTHLTGSFMLRSPFHGPMPRLRPQPLGFSMMVKARRVRRERLFDKRLALIATNELMRDELAFWRDLRLGGEWDSGLGMAAWHAEANRAIAAIDDNYKMQGRRAASDPSDYLVARVRQARRKRTQVLQVRAAARKERQASETDEERKGPPGWPRGSHRRGKTRARRSPPSQRLQEEGEGRP
ncbi:uncharacterized protein LOC62_05G007175 [Vanrija pseudolonga]|uniref:Uncharacterized protein n=1 Tax=Vanrija pseudolonga TaxID=143232 RepID=A0AAF1BMQ3_9TREE|nr:hypothetical protein LOC62_05G007175 [Vanrija pseudolonga]